MQQATQASLHNSQSKHQQQQQQLQQLLQQQQLQQLQQQLCIQIPGITAGMSTPSCIPIYTSIFNMYPGLYIPICNISGLAGEGGGSALSQLHGGSDNLSKLKMGDGGGENDGQVHLALLVQKYLLY
jgi:type II secretory pathway pseudopilin PulG